MKDPTEDIEFSIVTEFDSLLQLESDWNALWNNASAPYVSQSFTWCELSWREVASKRGRRLFCVVGRSAEKVVLIWPMMISTSHGCTTISPLGPEGSEYSLVLCAPGPHEFGWIQRALDYVTRHSQADLVRLPYTPLETPLGKALAMFKGLRFSTPDRTSSINWEGIGDWQSYLAGIQTHKQLQNRQRRRRNLVKQGEFCFELVEDSAKSAETLNWFVTYKYDWMETTGKTNAWLPKKDYIDFLGSYTALSKGASSLRLFRITVDGRIVAATLAAITPTRIEQFNRTHDPAWSKYSPGLQLDEDTIRWAFERGLTFDFRLGDESYKKDWCNQFGSLASVTAALTLKGALVVAWLHLKVVLRRILISLHLKNSLQRMMRNVPTNRSPPLEMEG